MLLDGNKTDLDLREKVESIRRWLDTHPENDPERIKMLALLDELVGEQMRRRHLRDSDILIFGGITDEDLEQEEQEEEEEDPDLYWRLLRLMHLKRLREEQGEHLDPDEIDVLDNDEYERALEEMGYGREKEPGEDDPDLYWHLLRGMHLVQLRRERGYSFRPDEEDFTTDDGYYRAMEGLGYAYDPNSEDGWVEVPPPPPGTNLVEGMDPFDRLYWAIDDLLSDGEIFGDLYDALPDPHAFVLGLLALVILQAIPGMNIVIDAALIILIGQAFFDLIDAISELMKARNMEELTAAKDHLGRAMAGMAIDALIAAATWGLGKLRARGSVPPKPPRGPLGPRKPNRVGPPAQNGRGAGTGTPPSGGRSPRRQGGTAVLKPAPAQAPPAGGPRRPTRIPRRKVLETPGRDARRAREMDPNLRPENPRRRGRLYDDERIGQWTIEAWKRARDSKLSPELRAKLRAWFKANPNKMPPKSILKGHVLEHPEPRYRPGDARRGTPARDGGLKTFGSTEEANKAVEKLRRADAMREKKLNDVLNSGWLRRYMKEGNIEGIKKMLRELIKEGAIDPSKLPKEIRALLK